MSKQKRMEYEHAAMRERLEELEEIRAWQDGPDKGKLYWVGSGDLVSGEESSLKPDEME